MSAGVVTRDAWIETMEPTLHELFTAGLEEDQEWKKVWTEKSSEKRREEVFEYVKPDVVQETPEGSPYVQLRIEKVRTASVVHADYTGMLRITHQMIRDKFYDDMEEQSWGLGEAINRKMYEEAVRFFYQGFGTVTSPDGVSWFNSLHTCTQSASTWSNYQTDALSADGYNNARTLMLKTLNENGKITPYGLRKLQLIVPAELDRLGQQLCMKGQYEPGGADFNVNVFEMECITLPMLGMAPTNAATSYFVRDPMKAKNYFFMREGPIFDMFRDPQTDDVLVKARCAFSFLIASARGVAGSLGTG